MPLTIAHPAAVIPLQSRFKNFGVLSALIIGSLTPDFAYLPNSPVTRLQSHSFAGMFWFCLPMGLITYYLFHNFMKQPLISLLPDSLINRLPEKSINRIKVLSTTLFLSICFSLLVGTTTHILWDSFTHEDGFAVMAFPIFQTHLFSVFGYDIVIYKILQHASTLTGSLLLGYWIFKWYRKSNIQNLKSNSMNLPLQPRILWIGAIVLITISASLIGGLQAAFGKTGILAIQLFEKDMIITGFVVAVGLIILYSLIYQIAFVLTEKRK